MPTRLPSRAATAAAPAQLPGLLAAALAFAALVVINVHTVTPFAPAFGGGARVAHRL